MSEWQPIETAPKDGELLLLWSSGEHVLGYYETAKEWPTSKSGFNQWTTGVVSAGQYDAGFDRITQPTHWMSLPEAPVIP